MNGTLQTTIREEVTLSGVGVHSGGLACVTLHPASADTGIVFYRSRSDLGRDVEIRADHRALVSTSRSTNIGSGDCVIQTIEHLMAAVAGLGIDNLLVEVDGDEIPVLDGSSAPFVDAIAEAGVRTTTVPRRFLRVLKPVRVRDGEAFGELAPFDGTRFEVEIDFADPLIGRQRSVYEAGRGNFARDVARARTFGFMRDVEKMWAHGLALGASFDNTVVLGEGEILNPEGLRYRDEFARHKLLDAIGDLRLAGAPLLGRFRSYRGGHALNAALVSALMGDPEAWTYAYATAPARRDAAHAEVGPMLPAAAYEPEID